MRTMAVATRSTFSRERAPNRGSIELRLPRPQGGGRRGRGFRVGGRTIRPFHKLRPIVIIMTTYLQNGGCYGCISRVASECRWDSREMSLAFGQPTSTFRAQQRLSRAANEPMKTVEEAAVPPQPARATT